jgi:hypothetical protein
MSDSTTRTVIWPRFAAQDRHVPKAAVPPAPSAFGLRRGRVARITTHDHLTTPAAQSII